MKALRKTAGFVIAVALILGWKFYDKSSTAKEVKQSMLTVCANDNNCENAVNTYFNSCFDSSYRMGSRRRAASLDSNKLAACINNNSGVQYFVSN